MKTAAIISEYNPFHTGHEYQIRKIREKFGEDTAIIAIMSGNYTQRAELALLAKQHRAKCAVLGGVNLVLELPFPFSSASAEFFARSGVRIADAIGVVDFLSFGSECGDVEILKNAAKVTQSDAYRSEFCALATDKTIGYPKKCEIAYKNAGGTDNFTFTSNNILAIEYIKAIDSLCAKLSIHTLQRVGADYNDTALGSSGYPSAMAIRQSLSNGGAITDYVPSYCHEILQQCICDGELPTDIERLSSALISHLRLNPPMPNDDYHDANDGLYNRLYNASREASNISSLFELTETKAYTKARFRRAAWNIFFGVTSSDVKMLPRYTQVLAMDDVGMLLLKKTRRLTEIPILTKPSATSSLPEDAKRQKELSDKADSVYELSKPNPKTARNVFTFTPFIKK